jgi:PST family polysaccharide transporter
LVVARLSPTAWVTIERVFGQAFGLLLFVVQAPLLGPHAFGLLATAMVFVGFWEAVPGAAAIDALISIRDIERHHFSAVTLMASALGAVLGVGLWVLSKPLAASLGDPGFVPIMHAMAVLPLIQALTIAPMAAAQRDMRFDSLTIRSVISLAAGGLVGLAAALAGFGVWALVWQSLVQRIVAAVVLWVIVPTFVSTSLSRRHFADVARFAVPNMFSRVMSWGSGQVPRLILSMVLGPTKLGVFTLATRLHDIVAQVAILPKATVARVDLRQFATRHDGLGTALRNVFLHIGLVTFPMCVGGAAIMRPLIDVWLDPRWHDAIFPCQMLLLMGIPFVAIYVSASLLLAFNFQRLEAVICTGQSFATIIGVWIAAPYGVSAAVMAMVVVAAATLPVVVIVMWRECGVRIRDILLPQALPLLAAIVMGAAILLCRPWLESRLPLRSALLAEVALGAVIYTTMAAAMAPRWVFSIGRHVYHRMVRPMAPELMSTRIAPHRENATGLEP